MRAANVQGKRNICSYSIPRGGRLLPRAGSGYPPRISAPSGKSGRLSTGPVDRSRVPATSPREAAGTQTGPTLRALPRARRPRPPRSSRRRRRPPCRRPRRPRRPRPCRRPRRSPTRLLDDGLDPGGLGGGSCLRLLDRDHRRELFLGRQLATLGHDHQLDVGGDVLEHADRDRVATDPLDAVDPDLATVDADLADPPDLVGDVGRRDRAEQRSGRARLDVEPQHELAERGRDLRGLLGAASLVHRLLGIDALDFLDAPLGRHLGEVPGEQVVPGVATRDVDDLSAVAELLNVLEQNDVHRISPRRRAATRPRGPASPQRRPVAGGDGTRP